MGSGVDLTPVERQEIRALLQLKKRSRLGDRGIKKLVGASGSGVGALRTRGEQLDLLVSEREDPPISSWLREGFGVLPMTSSRYPASLQELTDPPPVLFFRGDLTLLAGPAVAIVGSRRATGVGRRAAETMARILSRAGVAVVSGMALGIDGAAHRGALEGGDRTVAVLGTGLKVVYPAPHRSLLHEIGQRGLLVSEFFPEEKAMPHHFPKRNRIIAALVGAVVVVEAGRKSGALITVDHALDLGKEIMATPGSVESPQSLGSNILLREGARALPEPEAILDELEFLGVGNGALKRSAWTSEDAESRIPEELRGLWRALSLDPTDVEAVASLASIPVGVALAGLSSLELGGWALRCPGMRFRRSPDPVVYPGSESDGDRGAPF